VTLSVLISFSKLDALEDKKSAPNDSEKITQQYLDSIEKTGVPKSASMAAAFAESKNESTIASWDVATGLANQYSNVMDVLCDHYQTLYLQTKSSEGPNSVRLLANPFSSGLFYEHDRL